MEDVKSDQAEAMYNGSVEAICEDYTDAQAGINGGDNNILLMDQDIEDQD